MTNFLSINLIELKSFQQSDNNLSFRNKLKQFTIVPGFYFIFHIILLYLSIICKPTFIYICVEFVFLLLTKKIFNDKKKKKNK